MIAIFVDVVQMMKDVDQDGGQGGDEDGGEDGGQDDQHVGNLIAVEVGTTLTTSSGCGNTRLDVRSLCKIMIFTVTNYCLCHQGSTNCGILQSQI